MQVNKSAYKYKSQIVLTAATSERRIKDNEE